MQNKEVVIRILYLYRINVLFIIDARCGGNNDNPWTSNNYRELMKNIERWTTRNAWWNVVFLLPPNLPTSNVLSKLQLNNEHYIKHTNIGRYVFSNHNTQDTIFQHLDNLEISFQAYSDMIFIFSHPSNKSIQSIFSYDVYSKSLYFGVDIEERGKMVIISLIRSYMPNDWLLALLGFGSHIFNIVNILPIKILKIYVIIHQMNDMMIYVINKIHH
jgi:hypothetical protein